MKSHPPATVLAGTDMIRFPCYEHPSSSDEYINSLTSGTPPIPRLVCDGDAEMTTVQVGISPHARRRNPGPLGTGEWSSIRAGGRQQYIQGIEVEVYPLAMIDVGVENPITLSIHNATHAELQLLNNTFCTHKLVPMAHLRRLNQVRRNGIYVADYRGPSGQRRYTGGVNLSDRIVLTRGSLWAYRNLGINLTILHEIGHVLTHHHQQYMLNVSRENARTLAGTSENEGSLEGVCDQYMYLLCYAADNSAINSTGTRNGTPNGRRIIRATRAIQNLSSDGLYSDWQSRLERVLE